MGEGDETSRTRFDHRWRRALQDGHTGPPGAIHHERPQVACGLTLARRRDVQRPALCCACLDPLRLEGVECMGRTLSGNTREDATTRPTRRLALPVTDSAVLIMSVVNGDSSSSYFDKQFKGTDSLTLSQSTPTGYGKLHFEFIIRDERVIKINYFTIALAKYNFHLAV